MSWYVYYRRDDDAARVLQVAAGRAPLGTVLESLFAHARAARATAVVGRLEPRLVPALAGRPGLSCHLTRYWLMARSKHPELVRAIHRGTGS